MPKVVEEVVEMEFLPDPVETAMVVVKVVKKMMVEVVGMEEMILKQKAAREVVEVPTVQMVKMPVVEEINGAQMDLEVKVEKQLKHTDT
jgi:hypothetical protein